LRLREICKAWLPVILWMTLMFFGSTDLLSAEHTSRFLTPLLRWFNPAISPGAIADIHLLVRKAAHVTEYAVLTGLLFRAFRPTITDFWWRAAVALVPALLFAPADEFHQSFVPSRTSSPFDVLIDYAGAVLGIIICRVIHLALARRSISPG
jgi:VanZ family protein